MLVECSNCGKRLTAAPVPPDSRGLQCPHCGATVPIFDQNTLVSGGTPPVESAAPSASLQIEGYEILGCLGEGGMGIVYLARQVSLDRKVAIKVMSPSLLKDPSFVARFDRESRRSFASPIHILSPSSTVANLPSGMFTTSWNMWRARMAARRLMWSG